MKLPITGWNRTLKALGRKVVWAKPAQRSSPRQRDRINDQTQYEKLEPRQLLAGDTGITVQANLDQVLATAENPLVARLGQFDNDPTQDLAVLSSNGQLTVATNGDDGTWQSRRTVDLGVGPLHGMELSLVNDDLFADLILQGPDNIFVALNDGAGNFSVTQTLTPLAAGDMAAGSNDPLRLITGDLNGDFQFDIVALAPDVDQIVVYLGVGDGTFGSPTLQSTGGSSPTSIASGDFVHDALPDLAIGHADGTLTFLQNEGDGTFTFAPEHSVTGFSSITDLAADDLDDDGDIDIVVASGDQLTILQNEKSQSDTTPVLSNGGFGVGLNGWNVEAVGQPDSSVSGSVIAQSGFAQLIENESFLVSINQDIVIPASPEKIEFDILALGLEDPNGGVPDAFEISILDEDGNSLVPTFRPNATSFFNANPGATPSGDISLASGVTFDGTTVSVDISAIAAGTQATIYFDLIGNGPGNGSTVTIDNVRVTPENEFTGAFSQQTLAGPFVNVNRVVIGDVDGDQRPDIIATDAGNDKLLIFNGRGNGQFDREEINLSSLGSGLVSIDTAPLTAGDATSDIVVIAGDSDVAISPLSADSVGPTASLVSPLVGQVNTGNVERIDIGFDEPMRNAAPDDLASVTNPDNYSVVFYGADGIEGNADDVIIDVVSVAYDSLINVASLTLDPTVVPLADGTYRVVLNSVNLQDTSENPLADGAAVEFEFVMNSEGPQIDPVAALSSIEGGAVQLTASFSDSGGATPYQASINWGDGSVTTADSLNFVGGQGTLAGSHVYADNGSYNITLTVEDANNTAAQVFTTAVVSNALPIAVAVTPNLSVAQNETIDQVLATFTDAGFNNSVAGTFESFTASIDWGDGTTTQGTIDSTSGSPGTLTTGSVTGQHAYALSGNYNIVLTILDDDGGQHTASLTVAVANDVPVIETVAPISSDEGSAIDLQVGFTDSQPNGTYEATFDWGDGGGVTNAFVTFTDGVGSISGSHTYADNGVYSVQIELTDTVGSDSVTATASTTATIANVVPTLQVASDQTVEAGTALNFVAGLFTDPGFNNAGVGTSETFTATLDWGDGTTEAGDTVITQPGNAFAVTEGSVLADHTYTASGTYTVTLTLIDDDGGEATDTFDVTVTAIDEAPVLSALDPLTGEAGETVSLTAQFTDPPADGTYSATISWGDGSTSPGAVVYDGGNGTVQGSHVYADAGTYAVSLSLVDPAGNSDVETTTATITPVTIGTGAWLPSIDFDTTGDGSGLGTGDLVTEQWAQWGVHVTTHDPANHPAMIFDSANPTGSDPDLGTPNFDFGGPGQGTGGGDNSPFPNNIAQNNILIISEDGNSYDPDDNAAGGTLIFNFDAPVMLDEIRLLDIDNGEHAFIRLFDAAGNSIATQTINGTTNSNSFRTVDLSAVNVSRLEVELTGSGAITDVIFCRDSDAGTIATIAGAASVLEGAAYDLNLNANLTELAGWIVNWGDGQIQNVSATATSINHAFADGSATSDIVAYAIYNDGSVHQTNGVTVDINNVAPVLTIAGDSSVAAQTPFVLDLSSVDPGDDTITHWVIDWGDQTAPQEIIGNPDTVTHSYVSAGDYTIVAHAFDEDSPTVEQPSTLQIRAKGSEGTELFNLVIDGSVVATYAVTTDWQTFQYDANVHLEAKHVQIDFINDLYNPSNGIDRNLIVDLIDIDGRVFQTEADDVLSTATWKPADGITPGFRESEWLHANGFVRYDAAYGSNIEVVAKGSEGGEQFDLLIDGVAVQRFTVSTNNQTFSYHSNDKVADDQIRIEFVNDIYDPANGIDRNLIVDLIRIGSQTYQTEAADVYSTATWKSEDGITPGYRQSEWLHANGYFQFGAITATTAQPYVSNSLPVNVTPGSSIWLPTIDFARGADRLNLQSGEIVTDQFAPLGVHVTTNDPVNHPAMIFDSSAPTGSDWDLGSPNQAFGGPGVGVGGQSGTGINDRSLGNLLIVSEDANSANPDDNASGGTLIFTFDSPVMLDELGLLDIDSGEASIQLYDAAGTLIENRLVDGLGNNSYQTIVLDAVGVSRLEVAFTGSGAITELVFCRGTHAIEPLPTKFYTVDGVNDSGFQYDASGIYIEDFDLVGSAGARGVTTTDLGNPVWVVKSNEWVYVYDRVDNSFLGKWDAAGPKQAQGIATDGSDIWIVDGELDKVFYYADGADWTAGAHYSTSSFSLHSQNSRPTGLEVFGDKLWVSDRGSDKVFVYNTSGSNLGKWNLDSANGRSSGITTDASGQHLWVTDYYDGVIYYYAGAAGVLSGSLSATSIIQLDGNNQRPQGIADPTTPISIGDTVNDAITVGGEIDEFTFSATAGQIVYVQHITGGLLDVTLFAPDGSQVYNKVAVNVSSLDSGPRTLDQTGEYRLVVKGYNSSSTSNYEFILHDVPSNGVIPVGPNEIVDGEIAVPGEINTYTITSTGTESVYFDFLATNAGGGGWIDIELIDPDGETVFTDFNKSNPRFNSLDNGPFDLSKPGDYQFIVDGRDGRLFTYQYQLIAVPATVPQTIAIGDTVDGEIAVIGEKDLYEFTSNGTESVFIDFQAASASGGGQVLIRLIDPTGNVVLTDNNTTTGGFNALDNGPLDLTQAGTWQLEVDGSGANTFTYRFELVNVPATVPQPVSIGDTIDGEISISGQQNLYVITSTGNETVYIDFHSIAGESQQRLIVTLVDPDGDVVHTNNGRVTDGPSRLDAGRFALTKPGEYLLYAAGSSDDVMSYQFEIVNVPTPDTTAIDFNRLYDGQIQTAGALDHWTFNGTAGQSVYLELQTASGGEINTRLIAPDGSVVTSASSDNDPNDFDQLAVLPAAGLYTLAIDAAGDANPEYSVVVWDVPDDIPQSISIEQTVQSLRVPTQSFTWQFDGVSGQDLVLAATIMKPFSDASAGTINYTLTAPSGAVIFENRASGQAIPTLTETGTYTLTLDNTDPLDIDAAGNFSFRIMNAFAPVVSGETDSRGTDFWFGFPNALTEGLPRDISVFITSEVDTLAIVSMPGLDFVSFADVAAGEVVEVFLPQDGRVDGNGELTQAKGIHVISREPVAVYGLQQESKSTDAFLALPTDALGTEYIAVGYDTFDRGVFSSDVPSQLAVVAIVDGTNVTITPVNDLPNHPAGVPFVVTLNQGDVYQLQDPASDGDITGTSISSDQPVAVLSGHACANVPVGVGSCDYLIEQIPPVDTWGSEYLSVPLAVRTAGDTFRVIASVDNTSVSIDGQPVATLDRGQFYETVLTDSSVISGSHPILAVQYSNGNNFDNTETDPFMMLLTPSEQFRNQYTVTTLDDEAFATGHFLNIVIPAEGLSSLQIDGVTVDPAPFAAIGSSGFLGGQVQVSQGSHRITSDLPLGLSLYGFGSFDSYGYPGGSALAKVAEVSGVATTPDQASVQINDEHVVMTLVTDQAGQPLAEILVNYRVTGANPTTGFGITNSAGVATFGYTGANAGLDSIVSFVGGINDVVTVDWAGVEPVLTITSPAGGSEFKTGSSQLISGRALPGVVGAVGVEIVSVTIDGQLVDSFDAAGNYFGLINVAAGTQTVEVVATDRLGNVATQSVSLVGVTASPVDPTQFNQLADVAASFEYSSTSFNRQTNRLNFDYVITNNGPPSIGNGSLAAFDQFNPVSVNVESADGALAVASGSTNANSGAYFVLDTEVPATGLQTGQVSTATSIAFNNPARARFDFAASVLVEENAAPVFTSSPIVVASVSAAYQYAALATDTNNQTVSYSLLTAPAGMTIDPATGQVNWTPTNAEIGMGNAESGTVGYAVQILADDGAGGTAVQSFTLTLTPAIPTNRAPVFISSNSDTFNVAAAVPAVGTDQYAYQFQSAALDPEADTLTYSVLNEPTGLTIDPASGLVQWNVTSADLGSFALEILATDTAGNVTTQSFTLNIVDQVTGTITGTVFDDTNADGLLNNGETGLPGRTVFLDTNQNGQADVGEATAVTATDGTFSFSELLAGNYTVGQILETGRAPTWDSASSLSSNTQTVALGVGTNFTDLNFGSFANGNTAQSAPEITSDPVLAAKVNRPYLYQLAATDADGDSLTYSLINAPAGAAIDPTTGLISWTPTSDQQTRQNVLVQVDDGNGNVDVQSYDLLVRPEFSPPVITSTPGVIATVDELYEYAVVADDPLGQFVTYGLESGPASASVDPITGVLSFTPAASDLGTAQFTVSAINEDGQTARQTFELSVRAVNTGPVFESTPIVEATAGVRYSYTAVATDAEDSVSYELIAFPIGMTILKTSGTIRWQPTNAQIGSSVDVTVRATDQRGLSTDQIFSITVAADTEAPTIQINPQGTVFEQGQTGTFQLQYADNVGVASVAAVVSTADGTNVPITLDPNDIGTYSLDTPGFYTIQATVTDINGNVGTDTLRVRVIDPNDTTGPTVDILSPAADGVVTYLTDIVGTVTDDGDLDSWQLEYSLIGTNNWQLLAEGADTFDAATLATFDPTLLANNLYEIRLSAFDFSGNGNLITLVISVDGGAKLGNYATQFVDLSIPLAGIPIQIIRQYDTLNADQSGDFGYGWRLSIGQADIRESVPVGELEASGVAALFGGSEPLYIGARVFLTTPDGQRVGFTFQPEARGGLLGPIFTPKFVSDDTSYTLETPYVPLSQRADGTFGLFLFDAPYNPREYSLVSQDKVSYNYDQFNGLQTVTDRNGVTLEYRDDGIFSSTGAAITWTRDNQGRITEILDPAGNPLTYTYSESGDLLTYTDQVDNTWTHEYFADPAHYLKKVTGPRGNTINEVQYDDDGRFVGLVDGLGNVVTQDYDLPNNEFVSTDALGNSTTFVYDDRGNVTEVTDAAGNTSYATYDDANNPRLETSVTDARGNTTRFEYDKRGNMTSIEEPGGIFTRVEYDSFNNITRTIGPATSDPGDGYADTLLDSVFADGTIFGTTIGERQAGDDYVEIDSADIILGPEYDRDTQTQNQSDFIRLDAGDYVTVGFDELVIDRDGDDIFIITPLFGASFDDNGETAEVSVTRDGTNYIVVATIGLGAYVGVDFADAGITEEVLAVRITALASDDGNDDNDIFVLTGVQVQPGDFRTTRSIYDENGNLTSFTNAEGETETFVNDDLGRILSVIDPLGNAMELEYSRFKDPDLIRFADGSERMTTRNDMGMIKVVTNETGETVTFSYDEGGKPLGVTDALGNQYQNIFTGLLLTSTVDPLGRVTQFEYDNKNRLLKLTDPAGGDLDRAYDANNQLLSQTNQIGQTESWTYTSNGEVATYTSTGGDTTSYVYDDASNLVSATNGRGFVTSYIYDSQNRLTAVTDALGKSESYAYDTHDNQISLIDRNGNLFQFEYDNVGRLLSTTDALGFRQSWSYDDAGNNVLFVDERGNETAFEYDVRDRLVEQIDAAGFDQRWTYDDADRLSQYTDQEGNATTYTYDASNVLLSVTDLDGGVVQFGHDDVGNRITTTDELGRVTTRTFDLLDRVTATRAADGSLTQFSYDGIGNLLSLTDPELNVTTYQYNDGNDVVLRTDPLGNSESFEYDATGNLTRITDRLGRITEFTYDGLNRANREVWNASDGSFVQEYNYVFDDNSNLRNAGGPNSAYEFDYDSLNRVTSVDNAGTPNLPNFVLNYNYDGFGNLAQIQDNLGVTVNSAFDVRNLLASMTWSGGEIDDARVEHTYDGRGLLTGISRFSDTSGTILIGRSSSSFDVLGRVTQISHLNSADSVIADYQFDFDVAGQMIQQIINGNVSDYSYDDVGQLTAATNAARTDEAYVYDDNGNRISGDNVIGPNNQLLSDGNFEYQYDAEGNLIRRTEITTGDYSEYEFDHRNRMVAATTYSSGGVVLSESSYTYDVFDRMIARSVDLDGAGPQTAETTFTVYDGENAWADLDAAGSVIARYLFGEGLDSNIARWRSGEGTAWYLTDHLGSVRDIIDAAGTIINHIEYDSFGNILLETNHEFGDRFKFTGREWINDLGLYYFRARFYDPVSGKFVGQDPIGFSAGDANLQRYVGNNSLMFIDPTGTSVDGAIGFLLSRQGVAIASGVAGFAVGYYCSYLESWYGNENAPNRDAIARADANFGAAVGLAAGYAAGLVFGAVGTGTTAAVGIAGLFTAVGTGLNLVSIANEQNQQIKSLKVKCFAAEIVVAAGAAGARAIGRKLEAPRFPEGLDPEAEAFDEFFDEFDKNRSWEKGRHEHGSFPKPDEYLPPNPNPPKPDSGYDGYMHPDDQYDG